MRKINFRAAQPYLSGFCTALAASMILIITDFSNRNLELGPFLKISFLSIVLAASLLFILTLFFGSHKKYPSTMTCSMFAMSKQHPFGMLAAAFGSNLSEKELVLAHLLKDCISANDLSHVCVKRLMTTRLWSTIDFWNESVRKDID